MVTLFWFALALGLATTIMGYISSAAQWHAFVGMLRDGPIFTASHAVITTAILSALFYAVLAFGRWALG
jgi:hypothetical protein